MEIKLMSFCQLKKAMNGNLLVYCLIQLNAIVKILSAVKNNIKRGLYKIVHKKVYFQLFLFKMTLLKIS